MSRSSEVTILRREIKKLVSEIRDRDEATNRILKINEELRLKVMKQDMVITEMNRKLAYYENPHSPLSGNNIPARKKKSERNIPKGDKQNPKPTRKIGTLASHIIASLHRQMQKMQQYWPDPQKDTPKTGD